MADDSPQLTPRALVRDAAEQVRVAYDELHEILNLARVALSEEDVDRIQVLHYLAEANRRAARLGARVNELEALVHRPTARRLDASPDLEPKV